MSDVLTLFRESEVGGTVQIPYALVDSLIWRGAFEHGHAIVLRCRDFNVYTLGVPRERDAFLVYQSIVNLLPGTLHGAKSHANLPSPALPPQPLAGVP